MSRIWTVVLIDDKKNLSVEEHWTHMPDTGPSYAMLSEKLGNASRILAMIPGSHASGAKVYSADNSDKRRSTWVDPFDTPFESI